MNNMMKVKRLGMLGGLVLILTACGTGTPSVPATVRPTETTAIPPASASLSATIRTIEDWRGVVMEIATADPAPAKARADAVWQALVDTNRVPLVLGKVVVFLYKGPAESVVWRGVFTQWSDLAPLEGRSIGETDLWVAQTLFPTASRAEYKIVLNNKEWILDPANKATAASGNTVNSVLVMPGFSTTDESDWRPQVISGTLSDNIPIASRNLDYTVNYRVYTPAGYDKLSNLPVLYVLDGSDFISPTMGAMPSVLNNLSAEGRIRPVIAVFIDPYEPGNPKNNRREKEFLVHSEEYARFVATEMVPAIDAAYRTDPQPDARMIQGVSYGGLSATFIACSYPEVFHHLAALSPSYWVLDYPDGLGSQDLIDGARKMAGPISAALKCGGNTGIKCPALPLKIFLTSGLAEWDVGDMGSTVSELQQQGYPIQSIQVREGHAWSAWRGLLDEMLINFPGK